jgi:hypothetical protein
VCEGLFISNLYIFAMTKLEKYFFTSLCVFQRLKTHALLEDLISDVMISFSYLCACLLGLFLYICTCDVISLHLVSLSLLVTNTCYCRRCSLQAIQGQPAFFFYRSVYLSACILNFPSLLVAIYLNCLPFFMPLISDILLINGRETIVALLVWVAYPCMTYLFEIDFLL